MMVCLTPDDFTRQGESAATQWVKQEQKCCSLFGYKIKPIVIGIVVVTVFQYIGMLLQCTGIHLIITRKLGTVLRVHISASYAC